MRDGAGDPFGWLAGAAAERAVAGLHRTLRRRPAGSDQLLDLAGNDYLGLARHPQVVAAAARAAGAYGAGATGSRLVTGSTELHAELEEALAAFAGSAAALVFSSGYTANLGAVSALSGPGSLLVCDAGNHASLVDASRLARARVVVVPHRDVAAVDAALAGRPEERALVVTDSVFSADGDLAPLRELHDCCVRRGAGLFVDEAHAFGVVGPQGRGAVPAAALGTAPGVVRTVTLSKALGSQGGAVLGSAAVVAHLVDTARTFIFDTGLAPPAAGAALAALRLVTPDRVAALRSAAGGLAAGLGLEQPAAAVISLVLGSPERAVAAAAAAAQRGLGVGCFRPPSVPAGTSRLRLAARADLTADQIRWAVQVLGEVVTQAAVPA
ncbi:MAG: aminotransferase class I/II-fold pyridoxal phosphate-dependent enzyme [Mycobacteriales bacterium]